MGIPATPSSWSNNSIAVPVPTGATTGPVVVTLANGLSNSGSIFVVGSGPGVTSLSPGSGQVGAVVTIKGLNFGSTQGSSTVTFNGTPATPTNWNSTTI